MKILDKIKNMFTPVVEYTPEQKSVNMYVSDLAEYIFNGDKFQGSFGITKDYSFVDYYTLRKRSVQLFKENPYCDGLIKCLLRNEIADGLKLQASPVDEVLKINPEKSQAWADEIENYFNLYANDELICDWKKKKTLAELEKDIRRTALISGDCVLVLRIDSKTGLPTLEIIDGTNVMTPFDYKGKNKVIHGVELDGNGRQVAYHINNNLDESVRIPCWGEKSGRRIAWMVYGSTERMLDDVRGEPILAKMFYSMKELDRYRDSEQRAATINAMIPLIVTRDKPGFSGAAFSTGATRKDQVTGEANASNNSQAQTVNYNGMNPGFTAFASAGEKIESFNTQRPNINLGKFEETIFNLFCLVLEIPPEIGRLLFGSSYSASRQARNEFNMYLDGRAKQNGKDILKPIYEELVVAFATKRIIANDDLVQAWIRNDWVRYNAWLNAEWIGKSCPSVDMLKDAQTAVMLITNNLSTADAQTRKLVNMPYATVLKKRKREIELNKKYGFNEIAKPAEETITNEIRLSAIEETLNQIVDSMAVN